MRLMSLIALLVLVVPMMTGCGTLRRPDTETVSLCKRGFANDHDWTRASRFSRDARKLRKKFGSFHSTLWFRNPEHSGFASCSRDRCEDDRCLWLVRLFEKTDGQWHLASDYHLGVARKK